MQTNSKPKNLSQLRTEHRSITDKTADTLREAILEGVFAPGEPLKERELAKLMGVSTTPVKAALQRLALEGLVDSAPMKGSVVAEGIGSITAEYGLIRAALEGTAAYLAANKATSEDLSELRAQLEVMEESTSRRDVAEAVRANERFHRLIIDVARNNPLKQMSAVMRRYDEITRPQALSDHTQMVEGFSEHRAVFEAIAAGDPEKADATMREHILKTAKFLARRTKVKGERS
ncbi:MAG: GntR family transcriptional regulator [Trueperaceae bacterium]